MGWGASPTLRPPLPPGKIRYPLYMRLGGPQGRSGLAENLFHTGIRPGPSSPLGVAILTELPGPQFSIVPSAVHQVRHITICVIVVTVRKQATFIAVPEHHFSIIEGWMTIADITHLGLVIWQTLCIMYGVYYPYLSDTPANAHI